MPGLPGIFFFENKRLFFFGRCFAGLSDHCYIRLQRVSCSQAPPELPKFRGMWCGISTRNPLALRAETWVHLGG